MDLEAVRYTRQLVVLQDRANRGDRTADISQDEELTRYGPTCDKQDTWPEYGNVVVVDRHGVALLWSLPHLLLPRRVVCNPPTLLPLSCSANRSAENDGRRICCFQPRVRARRAAAREQPA